MTGPFVQVQESRLHGPTWINAARIAKIQQSSNVTTISLAGAGMIQIAEPAQAFVARLEETLAESVAPSKRAARPTNGVRREEAERVAQQQS
jgi:hypothetical protein